MRFRRVLLFPHLGMRIKREVKTQRMRVRVTWIFLQSKRDSECSLIQLLNPNTLSDTKRTLPLRVLILLQLLLRRVLTLNGLVVLMRNLIQINLASKSIQRGECRYLSMIRSRTCFTPLAHIRCILMKNQGSSVLSEELRIGMVKVSLTLLSLTLGDFS